MAETKYRDAYILVKLHDGVSTTKNTKIEFCEEYAFDAQTDKDIGIIDDVVDDILILDSDLRFLRQNDLIPSNEKPAFINSTDRKKLGITDGVVVMVSHDLVVVYCGIIDVPEEYGSINIEDFYNKMVGNEETVEGLDDMIAQLLTDILSDYDKEEECKVYPKEREEKTGMDNLFGNLGFGKLRGDRFKLSMNGIAVAQKDTGKYVVYNKDNNEFVDATNTLFDIKDALFILPAVEVNVGDTILHENKPYFIVDTTNEIKAVSYDDCTQTVLIPKSTMFGIKYFTKVFSMFGDNFASAGDLFSNPMMLIALMEGKNSDLTQLMLLSSLNNGELGSNPMALAMMLKGDKGDDSLSTIALMSMFNNGTNPFAPKKKETKTTTSNK
jgi:hypothetical protein